MLLSFRKYTNNFQFSKGTRTDLLVDGPLDFTYGGVERGKVVYQSTATFNSANLGCTSVQTTPPGLINFPTIFAQLTETSTNYSQAINNGVIDQSSSTIQFIGNFPINFFTIDAASLTAASLIEVTSPVVLCFYVFPFFSYSLCYAFRILP